MSRLSWKILLVDDAPEDRSMYRRYLQSDAAVDYVFWEASLGEEALAMQRNLRPDCILLDYQLPDINGLECLRRLTVQTDPETPPVVMLTGVGSESIAVDALKRGAADYLVKMSLTPESLQRTVHHAVEKMHLQHALLVQRQQIKESEERLRLALEAAQMGVWDWDIATDTVAWSEHMGPGFGLPAGASPRTLSGFLSLVHAADRERIASIVADAVAQGKDYHIEFRVPLPNGDLRWRSASGRAVCDATGKPVRLTGVDMDITARKQTEEALYTLNKTLEQRADGGCAA